jgi:CcmD family protein
VTLAITSAEAKYVAAAYGVVFLVVLLYVLIIALKLERLERELGELTERLSARRPTEAEQREEVAVG